MTISNDTIIFPCGMSRSGTTLLTTIIDSHSQVSMGYELIPPELPGPDELLKCLERGLAKCERDFSKCGQVLRSSNYSKEGLFFTRCYRAGIDDHELKESLQRMLQMGYGAIETFRQRLQTAWMIAKISAEKRGKSFYGFKLNIPSVEQALDFFPQSRLVYILRDPRDVVASHISRKFNRTVEEICQAWNNYLLHFECLLHHSPDKAILIRYEDLVSIPARVVHEIMGKLSLEMEDSLLEFYRSKAGIHSYGHPNADNLKKDFFTTSIGRWKKELDSGLAGLIVDLCGEKMAEYEYTV